MDQDRNRNVREAIVVHTMIDRFVMGVKCDVIVLIGIDVVVFLIAIHIIDLSCSLDDIIILSIVFSIVFAILGLVVDEFGL